MRRAVLDGGPAPWNGRRVELADEGGGRLERSLHDESTEDEYVIGVWERQSEVKRVLPYAIKTRAGYRAKEGPHEVYVFAGRRRVRKSVDREQQLALGGV